MTITNETMRRGEVNEAVIHLQALLNASAALRHTEDDSAAAKNTLAEYAEAMREYISVAECDWPPEKLTFYFTKATKDILPEKGYEDSEGDQYALDVLFGLLTQAGLELRRIENSKQT